MGASWLFLAFLLVSRDTSYGRPQSDGSTSCRTSDGLPGLCQSTSTCWLTQDQQTGKINDTFISTSDRLCGFTPAKPKICCPDPLRSFNFSPDEKVDTTVLVNVVDVNSNEIPDREVPWRVSLPKICGISRDTNRLLRVAGGTPSPKGSWPWVARLGYLKDGQIEFLCGGVLINSQYVLTAAHCVHNRRDLIFIRLGEQGANQLVPQDYYIENIKVHEHYSPDSRGPANDIALIRVSGHVIYTSDVHPICLPMNERIRNLDLVDTNPFLAGWGSMSFFEPPTNVLMEAQIPVVSQAKCSAAYKNHKHLRIDDSVLCAGLDEGGKDACRGDSGSPLMFLVGRRFYAIGLVSFGVRCAQPGFPGVYSRVSYHMNWILKNLL